MPFTFAWFRRDRRAALTLALAFALGAAAALAGLSLTSAAKSGGVVAVVNGEPISQERFYERLEEEAGEAVLDRLIAEMLVDQAQATHGVTVSDEEVEAEVARLREAYESEEAFARELERIGLTPERLREEIRLGFIVERLSRRGIEVTDEEIARYFEEYKDELAQKEAVRVSHILVPTKEEADEVARRLADGADFAELARAKSIDTASAVDGGEIGFIERDAPVTAPFKEAAFALRPGEVSAPVETEFGWHIIKVTARREPREATLAESAERIREFLLQEKARPVSDVIAELRAAATIDVRWERYAAFATTPAPDGEAPGGEASAEPGAGESQEKAGAEAKASG